MDLPRSQTMSAAYKAVYQSGEVEQIDEYAPLAAMAGKAAGALAGKAASAGAAKAGGGLAKAASSKLGQKAIGAGSNMVANKVTQKLSNEETDVTELDVVSAYIHTHELALSEESAMLMAQHMSDEMFEDILDEAMEILDEAKIELSPGGQKGKSEEKHKNDGVGAKQGRTDKRPAGHSEADRQAKKANDPAKKQAEMNRAGRKGLAKQETAKKGIDKVLGRTEKKDPMAAIRAKRAAKAAAGGKVAGQKPQRREYDQETVKIKPEKAPEKPNAPEADTRKLKPGQKKDTLAAKAKKIMSEASLLSSMNDAYAEVSGLGKH